MKATVRNSKTLPSCPKGNKKQFLQLSQLLPDSSTSPFSTPVTGTHKHFEDHFDSFVYRDNYTRTKYNYKKLRSRHNNSHSSAINPQHSQSTPDVRLIMTAPSMHNGSRIQTASLSKFSKSYINNNRQKEEDINFATLDLYSTCNQVQETNNPKEAGYPQETDEVNHRSCLTEGANKQKARASRNLSNIQILSNIKKYRYKEILQQSKNLSSLTVKSPNMSQNIDAYISEKKKLKLIRDDLKKDLDRCNKSFFRKYLYEHKNFSPHLKIMAKVEANKFNTQEICDFFKNLEDSDIQGSQSPRASKYNDPFSKNGEDSQQKMINTFLQLDPCKEEKKIKLSQKLHSEIEAEFEAKYRKYYDQLESDIKAKIESHSRYLVDPYESSHLEIRKLANNHAKFCEGSESYKQQVTACEDSFKNTKGFIRDKNPEKIIQKQSIHRKTKSKLFQSMLLENESLITYNGIVNESSKQNQAPRTAPVDEVYKAKHFMQLIQDRNLFQVQYNLEYYPETIALEDQRGNTPLHYAVKTGDEDLVRLILKKGCDPKKMNKLGKTAMDIAKHFDMAQIIEFLNKNQAF